MSSLRSIPYKVNREVLDFINQYGVEKGIILDTDDSMDFRLDPHRKRPKRVIKEERELMSHIFLQTNILNIAQTYCQEKALYFPIRIDQRTRLYCYPDYFHYQSTDLAKSLICFAKPGRIIKNATLYLKSYGAGLFKEDIGKKSLNVRAKWVDTHSDEILNFFYENNDIINRADNKACFLSFCIEYKRFIAFMDDIDKPYFATYLPIRLDASCNGYQHIN